MLHFDQYLISPKAPWAIFVHGAGGSSNIWFKQVRHFQKKFNVLLLDLRGHGKSKQLFAKRVIKYSFKEISNDVLEVMDHLNIKSAHFIGISLGTIIIREMAERHPERIDSMVMGGAIMKLNIRGQILMRMGSALKTIVPYLLLYKFFAFIIMPKKKHTESRSLFVNEAKKLYQKEFKRWFKLASEVNPLLKLFRIKDCGIPTLYIMGEEDYMFLPSISKLVEKHHSSILQVIPNCGHVVNVEKPDLFNQMSIDFASKWSVLQQS